MKALLKQPIKFLALILFLFSCQPGLVKKQAPSEAAVDSVLFYQKKDIADPLIDGLLLNDKPTVTLKTVLRPAPKPKPTVKPAQGYRVQVFASTDSLNAQKQKEKLIPAIKEKIYLIHEKNLYKVQVGDFLWRPPADSLRDRIKKLGFHGAWVVQRSIFIPIDSNQTPPANSTFFKIQVFVTGDQAKAQNIVKQLQKEFQHPVYFRKQGNVFKVFLGKFTTRDRAENILKKVKNLGYSDAWIVHKP